MQDLRIEVVGSAYAVDAEAWDACATRDDPFVEHAFITTMEDAGCTGEDAGWVPHFLVARVKDEVRGIVPLYLKTNSYGEYIFDWGWANGAQQAGLPYYPKLTAAVPFTPATGHRVLLHPDAPADELRQALARAALVLCERVDATGVHWLFCPQDEAVALAKTPYMHRHTFQYHWMNRSYSNFDDYLASLNRKRRKEVRRERRKAHSHGLRVEVKHGPELSADDWAALQSFYERTNQVRPWQRAYLTHRWFELVAERLQHRVVAVLAYDGDRAVAGTLNFRRGKHLYGRYWGCLQEYDCLHFECCYYRLIEYAIDEGIELFEAGAQGSHKLARGFLPALTHSVHFLRHEGLHRAVGHFIEQEKIALEMDLEQLRCRSPFREELPRG